MSVYKLIIFIIFLTHRENKDLKKILTKEY